MIAEALELIQNTARRAASAADKVAVIDLPRDPHRFGVVKPDGSIEFHAVAPQPRGHVLSSVREVGSIVQFATETLAASPSVWIDDASVEIVIDDDPASLRKDVASVPFVRTLACQSLALIGEQWLDQKSFVRLLRITLADAATDSSRQLLKVARALSFKNFVTGHGKVEHGRSSLGREIEEEVVSELGDLPESVYFNLRLFTDPALTQRFTVGCAIEVNTREGLFNLCPIPEELDAAVDEQLDAVYSMIEGEVDCPVFRGRP